MNARVGVRTVLFAMASVFASVTMADTDREWINDQQNQICVDAIKEVAGWQTNPNEALPKDKLKRAIEILTGIQYPPMTAVERFQASQVDAQKVAAYLKFMGVPCPGLRAQLSGRLISTAVAEPAQKQQIRESLKTQLSKPKFPTLLEASVDASLLKKAAEQKFWAFSKENVAEISKLKEDLKKDTEQWHKDYESVTEKVSSALSQAKTKEDFAKVEATADYKKFQKGLSAEHAAASKYLTHIREFAKKIQ